MRTREVRGPHGALGRRGLESTSEQPALFCSSLHSWSEQAKFTLSFPVVKTGECGDHACRCSAVTCGALRETSRTQTRISIVLTDKSLSCLKVKATGSHSGSAPEPSPGSPGKDEGAQGTCLNQALSAPPRDSASQRRLWATVPGGHPAWTASRCTHNPKHASTWAPAKADSPACHRP